MSGAHRKPAYEIGAPSITWHAGFWQPDLRERTAESRGPESFRRHDDWIGAIEELILHVFNGLEQSEQVKNKEWSAPMLSNLQPSRKPEAGTLRLLRRTFHKSATDANSPYRKRTYLDGRPAEKLADPTKCMTRYETVHIDGVWQSMPLDIRFEVNREYFTITTTIDFSRMRPQPPQPKQGRRLEPRRRRIRDGEFDSSYEHYRRTSEELFHIIETTNARRESIQKLGDKGNTKDADIAELAKSSKYLYSEIWDQLKSDLFYSKDQNAYIGQLGPCFVDFRNLSLQCSYRDPNRIVNPWKLVEGSTWKVGRSYKGAELVKDQTIFHDESLRRTITGHRFKSDGDDRKYVDEKHGSDDIEWVDAIHPVLLSIEPKEVNDQASDPVEYTFTKFCHDRCIYGSGFGPQIEDSDKPDPLTYILLFGFDEHRQMGRLLYRLHTLGTLRQAAIFDLRKIKHVYEHTLEDIEQDLRLIQRLVSKEFDNTYLSDKDKDAEKKEEVESGKQESTMAPETGGGRLWLGQNRNEEIGRLLTKAHNALGKLDGVDDGSRGEGLGWIPLRAWRSEYYLKRFDLLVDALNSSQIEGYQPYKVFIEHRLARAYHKIRLVKDQYSQLREKEIRLRKEWMSLKSENHQKRIADIQNVAEIFFFLVLIPYYTSHTLISALESTPDGSLNEWALKAGKALRVMSDGRVDNFKAVGLCLMVCIVILILFRGAALVKFISNLFHAVGELARFLKRTGNRLKRMLLESWRNSAVRAREDPD